MSNPKLIILDDELKRRFWMKCPNWLNKDVCWVWFGSTQIKRLYGQLNYKGIHYLAHRLSYVIHHNLINFELDVLHKCDNPPCVNPYHLFEGTTQDNSDDMVSKNRQAKGERNGMTKLNEKLALEIRKRAHFGESQQSIADNLEVSQRLVSGVISYEYW